MLEESNRKIIWKSIQIIKEDEIILGKTKFNDHWIRITVISIVFLIISVFLVSQALNKRINHDEDQYIACAELIKDGYVPYHDFYYHHLPFLPYIYAGLFCFTSHLVLSARLFSVFCVLIYLLLIYLLIVKRFEFLSKTKAIFFSISALFLIISTQIFRFSATLSWSHDFPVMLIVLAFFLFEKFFKNNKNILLLFIGMLLGIAVMAKLSYIISVMPFFLILIVDSKKISFKKIIFRILILLSGFILSILPLLILIASREAFEVFTYSIYDYHFRLDPIFLLEVGRIFSFQGYLDLYLQSFVNKQMLLPVLSVLLSVYFLTKHRKNIIIHRGLLLALLVIIFSFAGTFSREVVHKQYFYIIVIFLILNLYLLISGFKIFRNKAFICLFGIFIFVVLAWDSFHITHAYHKLDSTYLKEIHTNGLKIKQIVKDEKVVSLSPLYCLEGGCKIYPEFANGVFSWRLGSCEKVPDTKFTSIKNFEAFYQEFKPKYFYTGHEKRFEQNLKEFIIQKGFNPIKIGPRGVLWVK